MLLWAASRELREGVDGARETLTDGDFTLELLTVEEPVLKVRASREVLPEPLPQKICRPGLSEASDKDCGVVDESRRFLGLVGVPGLLVPLRDMREGVPDRDRDGLFIEVDLEAELGVDGLGETMVNPLWGETPSVCETGVTGLERCLLLGVFGSGAMGIEYRSEVSGGWVVSCPMTRSAKSGGVSGRSREELRALLEDRSGVVFSDRLFGTTGDSTDKTSSGSTISIS